MEFSQVTEGMGRKQAQGVMATELMESMKSAAPQMSASDFWGPGGVTTPKPVHVSTPLPLLGSEHVYKTLDALSGAQRKATANCKVVSEKDVMVECYYTYQKPGTRGAVHLADEWVEKLKSTFVRDQWNNIQNWPEGLECHPTVAKELVLDLPVCHHRSLIIPFMGPLIAIHPWGVNWNGETVELPSFTFGNTNKPMVGYPNPEDDYNVVVAANDYRNGALNSGAAKLLSPLNRMFTGADIVIEDKNLPHMVFASSLLDTSAESNGTPNLLKKIHVAVLTLVARYEDDDVDNASNPKKGDMVEELAPWLTVSSDWKHSVVESYPDRLIESGISYPVQSQTDNPVRQRKVSVYRECWIIALDMDYRVYLPVDTFAHRITIEGQEFSMLVPYDEQERTTGTFEYHSDQHGVMSLYPVEETAYRFSEEDGDMSLFVYEHNNQPFSLRLKCRDKPIPSSLHVRIEQTWKCIPPMCNQDTLRRQFELVRERAAESMVGQLIANASSGSTASRALTIHR